MPEPVADRESPVQLLIMTHSSEICKNQVGHRAGVAPNPAVIGAVTV